jgi:hypothetical protein
MVITSTGTLRRTLNPQERDDVLLWLSVKPACIRAKTLSNDYTPRDAFLSIKKWYEYDEKLSDKQLSTLKSLYKFRDKNLDKQLNRVQLGP